MHKLEFSFLFGDIPKLFQIVDEQMENLKLTKIAAAAAPPSAAAETAPVGERGVAPVRNGSRMLGVREE